MAKIDASDIDVKKWVHIHTVFLYTIYMSGYVPKN